MSRIMAFFNWAVPVVLALVLLYGVFVALADVAWCYDNYALDKIPHCLWYENSFFGWYIQPN